MIDRVMLWEMSQCRRRDLLETAGVAGRRTGVRSAESGLRHGWTAIGNTLRRFLPSHATTDEAQVAPCASSREKILA